jgi:hypothetical protein
VGDRREYFIGTVLVFPKAQTGHFEVIDGQQISFCSCAPCASISRASRNTRCSRACFRRATPTPAAISRLEPRYEHAGELMNRIVAIDADP